MRMCVVVPANENHEYDLTSYHHVGCFRMPRRFSTGASKMAPEDFVREYLTDVTENQEILPSRADEIADLIANSGVNQKGGKVKQEGKGAEPSSILARIKSAAEEEEAAEPKKKKIKKEQEDTFDKMVKAYKQHCKTKTDVLKDYLRYVRDDCVVRLCGHFVLLDHGTQYQAPFFLSNTHSIDGTSNS